MNKQTVLAKPQNAFTRTGPAIYIKPTPISKKLATRVNREQHSCTSNATNSDGAPR